MSSNHDRSVDRLVTPRDSVVLQLLALTPEIVETTNAKNPMELLRLTKQMDFAWISRFEKLGCCGHGLLIPSRATELDVTSIDDAKILRRTILCNRS